MSKHIALPRDRNTLWRRWRAEIVAGLFAYMVILVFWAWFIWWGATHPVP